MVLKVTSDTPVKTELTSIAKAPGAVNYGWPEKPAVDGYANVGSKLKVSDTFSRAKFKNYLEASASKEGERARETASPKVKGPLENNCRMYKKLGYSDAECNIMCLNVVRQLEKLGIC